MSNRSLYREMMKNPRMVSFTVKIKETDLWVAVDKANYCPELEKMLEDYIWSLRSRLENYIRNYPEFQKTLEPFIIESAGVPDFILDMVRAGNLLNIGPMAAVAGTFAEKAGRFLLEKTEEVIVENGGDIFLKTNEPCRIGVFAGSSPLSQKVALEIQGEDTPLGVCASSGSLGHSYSKGRADAVVIIAPSASLADAAATAICNMVKKETDVKDAAESASKINGISGALVIYGDRMGAWGNIKLCKTG